VKTSKRISSGFRAKRLTGGDCPQNLCDHSSPPGDESSYELDVGLLAPSTMTKYLTEADRKQQEAVEGVLPAKLHRAEDSKTIGEALPPRIRSYFGSQFEQAPQPLSTLEGFWFS
jgi:hypothetical protein